MQGSAGSPPLVLLTRPGKRNDTLLRRCLQEGLDAQALPALVLRPLPIPDFPSVTDHDLLIFVSGSAVDFFQRKWHDAGSPAWPARTLFAAVGTSTARALHDCGMAPRSRILHPHESSPEQDSEALWPLLQERLEPGRRILIARGETGREWLGRQLEAAGHTVERLALYRREPARWTPAALGPLRAALAEGRPIIVLITSSESLLALQANVRSHELEGFHDHARYVAIHPRLAQRLSAGNTAPSGQEVPSVVKVCTPDEDDIFRAIVRVAALRGHA